MPNILRNLRINRVASVDKGAGEGVQIMLMKRDEEDEVGKGVAFEHKADGTMRFWHDDNTNSDVDGSQNPSKDKKKKPKSKKTAKSASSVLTKGLELLQASVASLFEAPKAEQEALLKQTFEEFETHVQSEMTASGEEDPASTAAQDGIDNSGVNKGNEDMTKEEMEALQKKATDAEAALAKAEAEVAFLKMDPKHQEFAKSFDATQRAEWVKKDPKKKDEEIAECAKKALEVVPESVKKALAEAEEVKKSYDAMAKRVADLEAKDSLEVLAKRASDIGLPSAEAITLQKARAGDLKAVEKLEDTIKALTAQVKEGGLFKEFGTTSTQGGSAYDQINAKAAELRKADPKLTLVQAFEKAYTDPANQELVKVYKREAKSVAA